MNQRNTTNQNPPAQDAVMSHAAVNASPPGIKVTALEVKLLTRDWTGPSTASPTMAPVGGRQNFVLLTLQSDQGASGRALFGGSANSVRHYAQELAGFVREQVAAWTHASPERLWAEAARWLHYQQASPETVAAMDVALWDLLGQHAGLPLATLLGSSPGRVSAYGSSAYHRDADGYVREAEWWRERGVTAFKFHPGGRPPIEVAAIARELRRQLGDEFGLMLDASLQYGFADALVIGKSIQDLGFAWYEDPLAWRGHRQLANLAGRLDVPIAATDSPMATFPDLVDLVKLPNRGVDVLRASIRDLGVTGIRRLAAVADAFDRAVQLHVHTSALMNVANLHLAALCGSSLELVTPYEWVQWGLIQHLTPAQDGTVNVPQGPGLGRDLDLDLLHRHVTGVM